MKKCIGGALVALFCPGFNDVVVVVSSSSLAVEHNTTPSGIIQDQYIIQDRDIIKDPDVIILKDPEEDDHPPPTVGIRNVQPICPGNNDGGNTGGGGGDDGDTQQQHHRGCAVREMLVSAMESDDRLQVVGDARGELDCDSLDLAEGASSLMIRVSSTEVVEARVKSYTSWPGSLFSNNQPRKVWTGEVLEGSEFKGIPRSISMAWSGCDTESFLLEMIIPSYEGQVSAIKSVPCDVSGSGGELCLLQTLREGEDEGDVAFEDIPGFDSGGAESDDIDASRGTESDDIDVFGRAESNGIDASGGAESGNIDASGGAESDGSDAYGGAESDNIDASGGAESSHIGASGGAESDNFGTSGGAESDDIDASVKPAEPNDEGEEATAPPTSARRLNEVPKKKHTDDPVSGRSADNVGATPSGAVNTEKTASSSSSSFSFSPLPLEVNTRRRRRLIAKEVEEGVTAAHKEDPDLRVKDADLRLLNEYLSASSPEEKEAFHDQGLRRLNNDQVSMPSGRILADSNTIDVMVLYTSRAMVQTNDLEGPLRSESQMETDIIAAYEGSNNALSDSDTGVTLNVVRIERIDYEEGEDMAQALFDMYEGVGQAAGVHELRDEHGADLVQLVGFFLSSCGIGYTMQIPTSAFDQYGYSVVHTNCLPNFSHTHEVGHNLGANHDRTNSNSEHAYAYGYRYCEDQEDSYRTVMAYETGCVAAPRVNIFSTPDRNFDGQPQGTVTDDNARAVREAATTASNFRESVSQGQTPAVTPTPEPEPSQSPTPEPTPRPVTPVTTSIYPQKIEGKFWKQKGCWQDDIGDRVMTAGASMPAIDGITIGMTLDNCLAYCDNEKTFYKFFGVEIGNECFCWKNDDGYKRLGRLDESECDLPCEGQEEETCGGRVALEVFKIKKNVALDPNTDDVPNYEGCYSDDSLLDLELANIPVIDPSHATQESCEHHCSSSGYVYFALEFGFLCRCGNELPDPAREAEAEMCDQPCPGSDDNVDTCGGNWYIEVYTVALPETEELLDGNSADSESDLEKGSPVYESVRGSDGNPAGTEADESGGGGDGGGGDGGGGGGGGGGDSDDDTVEWLSPVNERGEYYTQAEGGGEDNGRFSLVVETDDYLKRNNESP